MKSIGIVRKIDELGRVVIPIELRNKLKIQEKDEMEVFVDGSQIILKKYQPNCVFCNKENGLIGYKDILICNQCVEEISKLK